MAKKTKPQKDTTAAAEQLSAEPGRDQRVTDEQAQALAAWWSEFERKALVMPVPRGRNDGVVPLAAVKDADADGLDLMVDSRAVNEALHALGCEVRLRWRTDAGKPRNGKPTRKYTFVGAG